MRKVLTWRKSAYYECAYYERAQYLIKVELYHGLND